jgi:hypothetical protein
MRLRYGFSFEVARIEQGVDFPPDQLVRGNRRYDSGLLCGVACARPAENSGRHKGIRADVHKHQFVGRRKEHFVRVQIQAFGKLPPGEVFGQSRRLSTGTITALRALNLLLSGRKYRGLRLSSTCVPASREQKKSRANILQTYDKRLT